MVIAKQYIRNNLIMFSENSLVYINFKFIIILINFYFCFVKT